MENLAGYALEANIGDVSMLRGADGITPTIGENGNWYLGETDTGKPSRGETGPAGADGRDGSDGQPGADGVGIQSVVQTTTSTEDGGTNVVTVTKTDGTSSTLSVKNGSKGSTGQAGANGADGKSAYQYAVEGGYTGTETEFAEKLASGALIVHVTFNNGTLSADKTFTEIRDAILAGTPVLVDYDGNSLPLISISFDPLTLNFGAVQCDSGDASNPAAVATLVIEITQNGEVNDVSVELDIPKTLPNPNAITFTGAVTGSYDGSAAMTVNIPSAVTDDHINSLIDTKLGVIENGAY